MMDRAALVINALLRASRELSAQRVIDRADALPKMTKRKTRDIGHGRHDTPERAAGYRTRDCAGRRILRLRLRPRRSRRLEA